MQNGLYGLISGIDQIVFDRYHGKVIYRREGTEGPAMLGQFETGIMEIKQKPKYIVEIPLHAEECMRAVMEYLSHPDNFVRDINNPGKMKSYNPYMRVIRCDHQQLRLVISPANQVSTVMVNYAAEWIKSRRVRNDEEEQEQKECTDALLGYKEKYSGEDKLRMVKSCGESYRLTYMDEEENRRKQISLGNYLLIDGTMNHVLVPNTDGYARKQRSDVRAERPICSYGRTVFYSV